MTTVVAILVGVLVSLVAAELYAWLPKFCDWLVRFQALRTPTSRRERLLEQWRADLDDIPGYIARLVHALDLYRARRRICIEEHEALSLAGYVAKRARMYRHFARAVVHTAHPLLVHISAGRRCNLDCGHCTEYDSQGQAVPLEAMRRRIDRLAELGTSTVAFTDGEPLLHPHLDELIFHVRHHGMVAGLRTNGQLLDANRIKRLNAAGLDILSIAIDNIEPDEVSQRSLNKLEQQLKDLKAFAVFDVHFNVNVGVSKDAAEPRIVYERLQKLGFSVSVAIDGDNQMHRLSHAARHVFDELSAKTHAEVPPILRPKFLTNVAHGRPNVWKCRAGARYLYVCEEGLVHYCRTRRGYPNVPLAAYSIADIRREFATRKSCSPYCSLSYVHNVSRLDELTSSQHEYPAPPADYSM